MAALGGRENAFTTRDYTGYYQQIPADKLEDVMKLESDRFANNQWPDDEFKREIEVVKEERRMRTEDQPRALLGEQQNAAVFTASPYHRPVVGWMSDLDAMTPDDARDFYQRWYVPANAAIVVAGDVDVGAGARAGREVLRHASRPAPCRRASRAPSRRSAASAASSSRRRPSRPMCRWPSRCRSSTQLRARRDDDDALRAGRAVGRARRLSPARGSTAP